MHGYKKPIVIAVSAAILVLAAGAYAYRQDIRDAYARYQRGPVPTEMTHEQALAQQKAQADEPTAPAGAMPSRDTKSGTPDKKPSTDPTKSPAIRAGKIPAQINLKVLFIPQAPFKVWDDIHEDACEEASALMLQAYVKGETSLTLDEMDKRILALADYQVKTYGDWRNSDAARTAEYMRTFLGLKGATVLPVSTADDIRVQLAAGRPVIIPAAGKLLKNPNFRNGGPEYHMFVLKGYRADGSFVANDPGTRLGENYVYTEATIMNAVHDWNGGDTEHGARLMIVVKE